MYTYIYIYAVCCFNVRRRRHIVAQRAGRSKLGTQWSKYAGLIFRRAQHMTGHIRKEPVRFDSFRFRTFRKFIGSVRFGLANYISRFDAARLVFFGRVAARSSSVRFGSAQDSSKGVQWKQGVVIYVIYILVYYIILPQSTAPTSHCTPL